MEKHIEDCINSKYASLKVNSDIGKQRIAFMKENIGLMTSKIIRGTDIFWGHLPVNATNPKD